MTRGRDPRRTVDVHPNVALVRADRLARVDPHPHLDRPGGLQRRLGLDRRSECIGRGTEYHEEGVAPRVQLDPAMSLEAGT